ncbi:MAG TPA: hypothetical protein VFQ39_03380 [Longimicrobium sp.]|nr:hypothetical protein [Longimicrobium sp.]
MKAIRARLAALLASFIVAALASRGVRGLDDGSTAELARWLDHTFELVLLLGYAVVHPWLQRRWNPTGAFTGEAARKLEVAAHVDRRG